MLDHNLCKPFFVDSDSSVPCSSTDTSNSQKHIKEELCCTWWRSNASTQCSLFRFNPTFRALLLQILACLPNQCLKNKYLPLFEFAQIYSHWLFCCSQDINQRLSYIKVDVLYKRHFFIIYSNFERQKGRTSRTRTHCCLEPSLDLTKCKNLVHLQ